MNDNADQKWRCYSTQRGEHARAVLHYTALAIEAKAWREMVDMEAAARGKLQAALSLMISHQHDDEPFRSFAPL